MKTVQVIGYIGRCVSIEQKPDYTLGPFAVQLVLILIAPALYAATIYMTLGRIILLTGGERYSVVSRRWLTKIFVGGDIVSFALQCIGQYYLPLTSCQRPWPVANARTRL